MIRIFAAFPIPTDWSASFLQISKSNSTLEKFKWTPPDNLHITLFFIGEIEETNLEKITPALKNVFETQSKFFLEFERIELRGKKSSPSMLWSKFKSSESFSQLSTNLHLSVKEFMTSNVVHQDPIPHCTLARIKPGAHTEQLNLKISTPEKSIFVNAGELWKTVQFPEGVKYERLGRWMFLE